MLHRTIRHSARCFQTSPLCAAGQKLSPADWKSKVLESDKPVVVDFFATWCGPCKTLSPMLDAAHEGVSDKVDFYVMDVDDDGAGDIVHELNITAIPDVRVWHQGKEEAKFANSTMNNDGANTFFQSAATLSQKE